MIGTSASADRDPSVGSRIAGVAPVIDGGGHR
jgi:hypothetical protein